jgi:hypothetical protein
MSSFYRRDDWVQDAMGNAISGAWVYVTGQPTNVATLTSAGFTPPTPQVQLYSDPFGINPITQPVITDGFGHEYFYTLPGTYTVTFYSPQIGITTLADQAIVSPVITTPPVNQQQPAGTVNGVNQQFTISSIPASYLLLWLNGVFQVPATNYTFNGLTIFMNTAPQVGDQLYCVYS